MEKICDMCGAEPAGEVMAHEGQNINVGEDCFWAMMCD